MDTGLPGVQHMPVITFLSFSSSALAKILPSLELRTAYLKTGVTYIVGKSLLYSFFHHAETGILHLPNYC